MENMEEYVHYNNLYDCYQTLLTEKQRIYFEEYYFNNLSLSEISENYNVSRNAAYKQIQITIKKLIEYEEKLKLNEKRIKIEKLIEKEEDNNTKKSLEELLS